MAEDYPNTPTDATEMVTEIYPGDDHPFPIPARVMERARSLAKTIRPIEATPKDRPTFYESHYPDTPALFGAWEDSITWLDEICAALHHTTWEMDGDDGVLVRSLVLGLERELLRQKARWEWARATWQYDPMIREAVDQQPGPGSGESTASPEAPALQ